MACEKVPLEVQPHIVSIGVPDAFLKGFTKETNPHLKFRRYPNFPVFELYECSHPYLGIQRICDNTRLVILDLAFDNEAPQIPLSRRIQSAQVIFPKAAFWVISETDEEHLNYVLGSATESYPRKIWFSPYVYDDGRELNPDNFYRTAWHCAFNA